MDSNLKINFSTRILEHCNADKNAAIYSILTSIDKNFLYLKGVYSYSLGNIPNMINSAIEIFTNQKIDIAKSSYEYNQIKKEKVHSRA